MANIIPAILESDIKEVQRKLDLLADFSEQAQLDLMDGQFVDNKSITPDELEQIQTELNLEAHLMVKDPVSWLPYLNPDSFILVYFHIEAVADPAETINQIRGYGFEAGVALNAGTPWESLENIADYIDAVLFMGIEPGFQGRELQPQVFEKIKRFAEKFPDPIISLDGGINESNIFQAEEAGVSNFCVGSAIFANGDVIENINKLKDKLT